MRSRLRVLRFKADPSPTLYPLTVGRVRPVRYVSRCGRFSVNRLDRDFLPWIVRVRGAYLGAKYTAQAGMFAAEKHEVHRDYRS